MNRDPRFALSQELEAKQTLLDQLRALAVEDPDFFTDLLEGETNLLELIAALDASIVDDETLVGGAKPALDKLQARKRAAETRIELKRRLLAHTLQRPSAGRDRGPPSIDPRRHRIERRHLPHPLTMRPIIPGTELIPIVSLPALYNPRDLALIRRTVASDTTDDEFALFIHWARSPFKNPRDRSARVARFGFNIWLLQLGASGPQMTQESLKPFVPLQELISIREASARSSLSRSTIRRLVARKAFTSIRVGRAVRIHAVSLELYLWRRESPGLMKKMELETWWRFMARLARPGRFRPGHVVRRPHPPREPG